MPSSFPIYDDLEDMRGTAARGFKQPSFNPVAIRDGQADNIEGGYSAQPFG